VIVGCEVVGGRKVVSGGKVVVKEMLFLSPVWHPASGAITAMATDKANTSRAGFFNMTRL
jgi:hypothetical protein